MSDPIDTATDAQKEVNDLADAYLSGKASNIVKGAGEGALAGVTIGTALGTVFPGIGNAVGAAAGAIIGALAGLFANLHKPTKEQVELTNEINAAVKTIHAALSTVPGPDRRRIALVILDGMRKHPGNLAICVGPNEDGTADVGCAMTSIEGIRAAVLGLDAKVKEWIEEYRAAQRKRSLLIGAGAIAAIGLVAAGVGLAVRKRPGAAAPIVERKAA